MDAQGKYRPLQIWAGLECTINRVGNMYRDQLELSGHYEREGDMRRLSELGAHCVRYPVLLERHFENEAAWDVTDRALSQLQHAGVEPIVGLLHHGSGVKGATLLDDAFPDTLAHFARKVALRYPWVTKFTPVNEPLTTARFATLYRLWHPHVSSDHAFVVALTNQILATQQSMRAICEIIPDATLVTTEDLGCTHSVQELQGQAEFENHRRWLTWDLLLGRVGPGHALWEFLCDHGGRQRLEQIQDNALRDVGAPIIIGINHYLTSERYLDTDLARYPEATHGSNGIVQYADIEAVRVGENKLLGLRALLQQTWERYRLPIAITEAHLSCTREQQLLWLNEVWTSANSALADGVDVRAVTAWAAFGSFDWNSLLTRNDGHYETGLYDLRAPEPRATALATMVRSLSATGTFVHPALAGTPWWHDGRRVLYPALTSGSAAPLRNVSLATTPSSQSRAARPLLITGSGGTLGQALARLAGERGLNTCAFTRAELDITDVARIQAQLDDLRPWAVINAAGWVAVDDAEVHSATCHNINACGAEFLARACADRDIRFVTFSTDLVFSGDHTRPRVESDQIGPLNVYGHSKADAEKRVRACAPDALIVRTSAFFGDWDTHNFVHRTLTDLSVGQRVRAPSDAVVSPTYVPDLVHAVLDLLIDGERGIWHLANKGAISWLELARTAASMAGLSAHKIEPCQGADVGWIARRPPYSALASERANLLPSIEHALHRFVRRRRGARV